MYNKTEKNSLLLEMCAVFWYSIRTCFSGAPSLHLLLIDA